MAKHPHVNAANRYARGVVRGSILACGYVQLACARHLDDLASAADPTFPYRFDKGRAEKVCRFVESFSHVKGVWAKRHEQFRLEPWQCFVTCVVFGWVAKASGFRRYRRAYIEVPRKNGKSFWSATLAHYMLVADGEHGAEVYCGATTEAQALEVFRPARRMALQNPDYLDAYGIEVNVSNINRQADGSRLEPIIGKPGDGPSPSFAITDEYHEHATATQYDAMLTGMGSREQPLAWVITTAGDNTSLPCYQLRDYVVKVLEGSIADESQFGIIYGLDVDEDGSIEDWTTDEAIRKSNPNAGVSVSMEFLQAQQAEARVNAARQNAVLKKHFNIWVNAHTAWMESEKWKACGDAPPIEDFASEPAYMGLDLASKHDITARSLVFTRGDHYYLYSRFWVPEDRVAEPKHEHYGGWVSSGALIATDGGKLDFSQVEKDIEADTERFRVVMLGHDSWMADQLVQRLEAATGVTPVAVPQTTRYLSDPMKWLYALVKSGQLHHDNNPVMSWMISNVVARTDANDNIFPRKGSAENKIDGVISAIMALWCSLNAEEQVVPAYAREDYEVPVF